MIVSILLELMAPFYNKSRFQQKESSSGKDIEISANCPRFTIKSAALANNRWISQLFCSLPQSLLFQRYTDVFKRYPPFSKDILLAHIAQFPVLKFRKTLRDQMVSLFGNRFPSAGWFQNNENRTGTNNNQLNGLRFEFLSCQTRVFNKELTRLS